MEIKNTAKFYEKNRYVLIKSFIAPQLASFIYHYAQIRKARAATMNNSKWPHYREDVDGTFTDAQVPGTYSCYSDPMMETLLLQGLQGMRKITGLNLAPTYSYWRLYKTGDVLKRHKDRPSCEVSTTLCLGYNNSNLKDTNILQYKRRNQYQKEYLYTIINKLKKIYFRNCFKVVVLS